MLRLSYLLLLFVFFQLYGLEKLGTSFQFLLPPYMEESYQALPKEHHFSRWLWVSDLDALEFLYIHEDKSPYNYNEAFMGEKYLSPLELEDFVSTYRKKVFPGEEKLKETREYLDKEKTRLLVYWKPIDYHIPVQRLSLFQKGIFGGIFVFSFVANHSQFQFLKYEEWKRALKQSRITYEMR